MTFTKVTNQERGGERGKNWWETSVGSWDFEFSKAGQPLLCSVMDTPSLGHTLGTQETLEERVQR